MFKFKLRTLFLAILLLSGLCYAAFGRVHHEMQMISIGSIERGDVLDVFAWPANYEYTGNGCYLSRVCHQIQVRDVVQNGDNDFRVTIAVSPTQYIAIKRTSSKMTLHENYSNVSRLWVD